MSEIPYEGQSLLAKYASTDSDSTRSDAEPTIEPVLRWMTNGLALASIFFFSGIIFGWAPLELMLLQEGQYSYLCDELVKNVTASEETPDHAALCHEQVNALAGLFTVGQFCINFFSLFGGFALDYFSKSVLLTGSGILHIAGLTLLGISDTTTDVPRDFFYISFVMLAISGSMTMLSAFPASFLLRKYQAGLLAGMSCMFDASAIVFSAMKAVQDQWGLTRRQILLGYAGWAALIYISLVACWIRLERANWQEVVDDEDTLTVQQDPPVVDQEAVTEEDKGDVVQENQEGLSDPNYLAHIRYIQSLTVVDQLKSFDFGFIILFTIVHMLQANYYIMTVDGFLLSLGDSTAFYATLFGWALPFGVFFVPFIERTVTYLGMVGSLQTTNVLAMLFGVILWIPNLNVQAVNFFVFTGFRAFLYSTITTVVAVTFGVRTMGRIVGVVFTSAAVFGLVQYPLSVITEVRFEGNYFPMNFILWLIALIPIFATVRYWNYVAQPKQE
eukprot:Nitzschia sp. Nitz4//scaffold85_size83877//51426//52928//NITZ4_005235-RA/size83877-processed-gene-0.125-mRNA-1//1//CDS//3329559155//2240//frame0